MKKIVAIAAIILCFLWGCKKSDDSIVPDPLKNFCKEVTIDQALVAVKMNFLFDDQKRLIKESTTEDGVTGTATILYNTDGTVKDLTTTSFIYADKELTVSKTIDEDGNPHYLYFSKGLCTGTFYQADDETRSFQNTNNADGDCIKIEGNVDNSTSTDKESVTIEYFTDKLNPFPSQPEFIAYGLFYQVFIFSHKHLLSKINRTWTVTDKSGTHTYNFIQSYTYTYDSQGRVKTMVHTGNTANTYTFTYAQCL